jgi:hypothetical protein
MNHHPSTTPAYVVTAIPGAAELADEFLKLRTAHGAKATAALVASEQARDVTTPHLLDPLRQPRPGVARADWDRAIDAYRVASDEVAASDRALDSAVRKFSDHINQGRLTEAFKAQYAAIGDAAQKDASDKLTALRAALTTRDEVNRWMGRQIKDPTAHGVSYTLREIASYVEATPTGRSHFKEKALDLLAEEILIPRDRSERLRIINALDAREDLTDAEKVTEYRARAHRGLH